MWGSSTWGQMVWGGTVVPSLPLGMLVVLMLACFLAGGYFLHPTRHDQRNTIVALLLSAIPLSVGAVTLPYAFTNGTIADATQVNANFAAVAAGPTPPACPEGMTRIEQPLSVLCYAKSPTVANWDQAAAYCDSNFRTGLCSVEQWRAAVCYGGVPSPGRSWTDDVSGSTSFGSIAGCTGDAISSSVYTTPLSVTCCAEWPRY